MVATGVFTGHPGAIVGLYDVDLAVSRGWTRAQCSLRGSDVSVSIAAVSRIDVGTFAVPAANLNLKKTVSVHSDIANGGWNEFEVTRTKIRSEVQVSRREKQRKARMPAVLMMLSTTPSCYASWT